VVQPTYVWANAGHYPLPVRIDGGDIETLAEALVQRIQWPKDMILILRTRASEDQWMVAPGCDE
jgi:hypothetical protein